MTLKSKNISLKMEF